MKILALDLSSSTGIALLEGKKGQKLPTLREYGSSKIEIEDFNVNGYPNKSPKYPKNIIEAAENVALSVKHTVDLWKPDIIVIENTVKGRNRHTQRLLEWIHLMVLTQINDFDKVVYMDPSEWRKIIKLRMTDEDKSHNKDVAKGKIKGKITKKHLSVRYVNDIMDLKLKLKDNDIADAIALGLAYWRTYVK